MIGRACAIALMSFLPIMLSAETCPVLAGFVSSGALAKGDVSEAQCSVLRVLGAGKSEDCFWHFPLRSEAAQNHFERLHSEMQTCSEAPLLIEVTDVNHPDSFNQITGLIDVVPISLSLKDKGGLSATLVVLRRTLP